MQFSANRPDCCISIETLHEVASKYERKSSSGLYTCKPAERQGPAKGLKPICGKEGYVRTVESESRTQKMNRDAFGSQQENISATVRMQSKSKTSRGSSVSEISKLIVPKVRKKFSGNLAYLFDHKTPRSAGCAQNHHCVLTLRLRL